MLRCVAIGRFSLGNDEIEEMRWARLPFGELLGAAAEDGAHPPLDFVVHAALDRLSLPEWAHRVPGVLAGVGTVGFVFFLGARWFGGIAGAIAALLLAFSPIHVRYSQEVRPYALGLFFLAGSLVALESYRVRRRPRFAALWFLGVAATAYTLYAAGMIAAFVSLCVIFSFRKQALADLWRRMPLCAAGWIALYLPWVPSVLSVAGRRPPFPREALDPEWFRHRFQVLATGDWQVEPISAGSWAFWVLVAVGLAGAWRTTPGVVVAAWFLVGGALQLLVLQLRPHFPAVRHLLPSWLAAPFLAGEGFQRLAQKRVLPRLLGVVLLCVVLVFDAQTLGAYYDHGRPSWDRLAIQIAGTMSAGEHLIAANSWTYRNLGYYWNDRRLGRPGVALERRPGDIEGPARLVISGCVPSPEVRRRLDRLTLELELPSTNHCEVRRLPAGERLVAPSGICVNAP